MKERKEENKLKDKGKVEKKTTKMRVVKLEKLVMMKTKIEFITSKYK